MLYRNVLCLLLVLFVGLGAAPTLVQPGWDAPQVQGSPEADPACCPGPWPPGPCYPGQPCAFPDNPRIGS